MAKSATHQSSSKRKKMEHFPDKDTSVDRISNLPDYLLCHILSFLPTNEAVVTTILSSRWKPLWTLIPKLDLEDNSISDRTVYSVLAQHAAPVLQNFTLSWRSPCRTSHLNKWIHTAMSRNVQQLDLQIECGRLFELPHTVFHCKTLVVLELSGEIKLDPPPSFQLPSLKILRLYEICYISHNSFSSLCSACPILEDLKVLRDDTDNVTNFKINVPTLKRLYIELVSCLTGEPPDFKVEIYAPVLQHFRFYGDLRNIVFLEKLAHLVEAHIDVHTDNDWVRVFEFYYGDRVFKLLKELNNAKFLSIFPGDKEVGVRPHFIFWYVFLSFFVDEYC